MTDERFGALEVEIRYLKTDRDAQALKVEALEKAYWKMVGFVGAFVFVIDPALWYLEITGRK